MSMPAVSAPPPRALLSIATSTAAAATGRAGTCWPSSRPPLLLLVLVLLALRAIAAVAKGRHNSGILITCAEVDARVHDALGYRQHTLHFNAQSMAMHLVRGIDPREEVHRTQRRGWYAIVGRLVDNDAVVFVNDPVMQRDAQTSGHIKYLHIKEPVRTKVH